jgi:hypothetical protein
LHHIHQTIKTSEAKVENSNYHLKEPVATKEKEA